MPYWPVYSIYGSQNPSTSDSPSMEAKEKGPPSDLESHVYVHGNELGPSNILVSFGEYCWVFFA